MKVTGYKLREQIRQNELRLKALNGQFAHSLHRFPDEDKVSPEKLMDGIRTAELNIAAFQVAQMRYNLTVQVEANGEKITLADAIKRLGPFGRFEKLWRKAAGDEKRPRWDPSPQEKLERNKDTIVARPVLSFEQCSERALAAAKAAGALRAAVAQANAQEVEIEMDATLLR